MKYISYLIDYSLTVLVLIVLTVSFFNCFCIDTGTAFLLMFLSMRGGLEGLKWWYKSKRRQWVAVFTFCHIVVMYIILIVGLAKI